MYYAKEKLVSEPIWIRAQNKPGFATVDSCFVLLGTLQYGVAAEWVMSNELLFISVHWQVSLLRSTSVLQSIFSNFLCLINFHFLVTKWPILYGLYNENLDADKLAGAKRVNIFGKDKTPRQLSIGTVHIYKSVYCKRGRLFVAVNHANLWKQEALYTHSNYWIAIENFKA